ncbi:IclR family transcriptional regulator [soil metagenome]
MKHADSLTEGSTSSGGGTQAVDRAAMLIDLVIRSAEPMSSSELSESAGLARSTTSRLLAALERTELLERQSTGLYVGGQLFALYAALHDPLPQVARIAEPVLATVGQECGETVHLGVAQSGNVFYIAQVESTYLLAARDWNEVDVPVHCSSLGKVLCAYGALRLPTGSLEQRTPQTKDRAELLAEFGAVRQHGYAQSIDELEIGLSGLAAPVVGLNSGVIAALGVSGPTARLEGSRTEIGELLTEQGARLAALLRKSTPTDKKGAA